MYKSAFFILASFWFFCSLEINGAHYVRTVYAVKKAWVQCVNQFNVQPQRTVPKQVMNFRLLTAVRRAVSEQNPISAYFQLCNFTSIFFIRMFKNLIIYTVQYNVFSTAFTVPFVNVGIFPYSLLPYLSLSVCNPKLCPIPVQQCPVGFQLVQNKTDTGCCVTFYCGKYRYYDLDLIN